MWVIRVERHSGDYFEPEIIDLDDGSGCLFKFHDKDISEPGVGWLSRLLTDQAQRWAPRPADAPLGPVIPVRFELVPDLPDPLAILVDDTGDSIIYTVDDELLSEHAAEVLGRLDTERSPYWMRVPEGYHQSVDYAG